MPMLPDHIQKWIDQLPPLLKQLVGFVISFYEERVRSLETRLEELEKQKAKNSRNSSKPPSTDPIKKKPKSLRTQTDRSRGGQKGHPGTTLKMVAVPDEIKHHKVTQCSRCGKDLSHQAADRIERRQVYDIPPLELKVTEHQSPVKDCSCGCVNKSFPSHLSYRVQYGPNLKGILVYLQNYQLLPYGRSQELVKDFWGHHLSTGTLHNWGAKAYQNLEPFKDDIKELLTKQEVVGFDETGFRVNAQKFWLHSCSTSDHAFYEVHSKRGSEAMKDISILPDFKGIAVHDFWTSYYTFSCQHSLCNAHLLRDLIFIKEQFKNQDWAQQLIDLLLKMKQAKEKALSKRKDCLSTGTLKKYQKRYLQIVDQGLKQNPWKPPEKKSRGRYKKPPPRNLLERCRDYSDDIIRFLFNFQVPFDNNFSERDLRMMKVKQKISGGFRSLKGAKHFARIRSYIVTARKQNVNPLKALTNLFEDNTIGEQLTHAL